MDEFVSKTGVKHNLVPDLEGMEGFGKKEEKEPI